MKETNADAIIASLEVAAERRGDLTDAAFTRLFAAKPEMAALFARDTNGAIKGEMLARVFEMILDYVGDGAYAAGMIRNEVVTQQAYDVPADVFPLFFDAVAEALREEAAEAWTPAMSRAWDSLLEDFHRLSTVHG